MGTRPAVVAALITALALTLAPLALASPAHAGTAVVKKKCRVSDSVRVCGQLRRNTRHVHWGTGQAKDTNARRTVVNMTVEVRLERRGCKAGAEWRRISTSNTNSNDDEYDAGSTERYTGRRGIWRVRTVAVYFLEESSIPRVAKVTTPRISYC